MIRTPADRDAFIVRQTRLVPVPLVPEIRLHVAEDATDLWQTTEDELGAIGLPPPFWAFAWAGGQALARHILDAPALVRGRSVLDFAAGSGLVGIAAAKAGAALVTACDIDAFAGRAMALNAGANDVTLAIEVGDLVGRDGGWDMVLAGDIAYQADMAAAVLSWLEGLAAAGRTILIGDPGRSYLPRDRLERVATYAVPVNRSLEDADIKETSVWRFRTAVDRRCA